MIKPRALNYVTWSQLPCIFPGRCFRTIITFISTFNLLHCASVVAGSLLPSALCSFPRCLLWTANEGWHDWLWIALLFVGWSQTHHYLSISLLRFNEVYSIIFGLGDPFQIEVNLQSKLVWKPVVAPKKSLCHLWRSEVGNGDLGEDLHFKWTVSNY